MPGEVERIVKICREDSLLLEYLDSIVEQKLSCDGNSKYPATFDRVDVLLASFYQQKRPCPLLNRNGECSIYPLRPLTCRIYVNFYDPLLCDPQHINSRDIPNYLLDLPEETNVLLDRLHFRFDSFKGNTGLRSLLLFALGGEHDEKG
jgi:hypothetical protein